MPDFDLQRDDCRLLVVDVQERFRTVIPAIDPEWGSPRGRSPLDVTARADTIDDSRSALSCGAACALLLRGMRLLGVPTLFSEQSPDKLGPTLPALRELAPDAPVLTKTAFSCGGDPAMIAALQGGGRQWLVLCGIEAHVCVLGSVDDLLRHGWNVVVAADAVASRREQNRDWALAAMRQLGALVLPVESILFRLQRDAGNEGFRELSRLLK